MDLKSFRSGFGLTVALAEPGRDASLKSYRIVLLVPFLFLVWANAETPFWADDYCRIVPVSLATPLTLAYRDYFDWTGRFFTTALTYYALDTAWAWTKFPLDFLNAAIFVALIDNVLKLSRLAAGRAPGRSRTRLGPAIDVVFVFLMLWWLPRTIGEVALWKTGSIGYLWPVTGEVWIARLVLQGDGPERRFGFGGFAFVVATFLEPLSILMSLVLAGWCSWCWRRQRSVPVGIASGHSLGTAFLLLAPGNLVRAATLPASSLPDRLDGVVANLGSLFDLYWLPAIAVTVLAFAEFRRRSTLSPERVGHDETTIKVLQAGRGWVFIILALAYMLLLLGLPRESLAARVSYPASVLLVCYIASVFSRRPAIRRREWMLATCLLALMIAHTAITVHDLRSVARIHDAWASDPQLRMGPETNVVLPLVRIKGRTLLVRKHVIFVGFTSDPAYFVNSCYARAMHVASVVAR